MKHRGSLTFGIGRIKRKTKNTIVRTVPKFNTKILKICHNVLLFFLFLALLLTNKFTLRQINIIKEQKQNKKRVRELVNDCCLMSTREQENFQKQKRIMKPFTICIGQA
jgi:hypothetical protein